MDAAQTTDENRKEERWLIDRSGFLWFDWKEKPTPCSVRDWSAHGARIEVPADRKLPEKFKITIDFGKSIVATATCSVIWREAEKVGLQFDEELSFEAKAAELRKSEVRAQEHNPNLKPNLEFAQNPDGQRVYERLRTLKGGVVHYVEGQGSRDCTIRDLTPLGARLRFPDPYDGPEEIKLQIGTGDRYITRVLGKVVWRRGNEAGVSFHEEAEL